MGPHSATTPTTLSKSLSSTVVILPHSTTTEFLSALNPTCTLSTMWTWVLRTIPMLGKEREVAEAVMSISINMVHLQRHFDMLLDSLLILRR
jgi:hypothetical protein